MMGAATLYDRRARSCSTRTRPSAHSPSPHTSQTTPVSTRRGVVTRCSPACVRRPSPAALTTGAPKSSSSTSTAIVRASSLRTPPSTRAPQALTLALFLTLTLSLALTPTLTLSLALSLTLILLLPLPLTPKQARALVLATGAMGRPPSFKGEGELLGKGVSYCATCDGAFYCDREIAVVGVNKEVSTGSRYYY